jgi:hypothetical protein
LTKLRLDLLNLFPDEGASSLFFRLFRDMPSASLLLNHLENQLATDD